MTIKLFILVFFAFLALTGSAQAQVEGCSVNGYECLLLTPVCSHRWQVTNANPFEVEALWQIWSAYEYGFDDEPPIILYEGTLNIPANGQVRFSSPVSRPLMIVWGALGGGDGPKMPSGAPCDEPPPFTCTNVFKITMPESLRSANTEFVIYHIGDVFLDSYTDDDLGFEISMGQPAHDGQVSLMLCDNTWPAGLNFVGMVEADGSRTPIIEFSLGATWPVVQVVWTAPGVENAL